MEFQSNQIRHSFGILFLNVAISVVGASILSEIAFLNHSPIYYYYFIWFLVFGLVFGTQFRKFRSILPLIRQRMKKSATWPMSAKAINGICWALPFVLIVAFPEITQYLILLGIGLGNISTFVFMKKFSGQNNYEQFLVGIISVILIPIAFEIDSKIFIENQNISIFLSRIFISAAYAIGGLYAIYRK